VNNFGTTLAHLSSPALVPGLIGTATTAVAATAPSPDWRVVAVNAGLSLGLALLAHAARRRERSFRRQSRQRKPNQKSIAVKARSQK